MKLRSLVLLAAAILAALALSACGGSSDDSTSGEASVESFCSAYTALQVKTTALQESASADFADRKEALSNFVSALNDLADSSPPEIADKVEQSAAWARGAEEAVSSADNQEDFEAAGSEYAQKNPQPTEASQAADSYAQSNCDVGDDTSGDTTG